MGEPAARRRSASGVSRSGLAEATTRHLSKPAARWTAEFVVATVCEYSESTVVVGLAKAHECA